MTVAEQQEHQKLRRKFWMDVWIAVANSATCTQQRIPHMWADQALQDFDKRFNPDTE